jgi:histone deacetylase 1/2
MQTDSGGTYEKIHVSFHKVCITHHVSYPHAHRHIVKVGLALLANASMPLKFWD